jgi:hypothetical protein
MAFWQARDFLFCGVCGTLLDFDNVHYASCPLCGFKRMAKGLFPALSLPGSSFTPAALGVIGAETSNSRPAYCFWSSDSGVRTMDT